MHSSLSCFLSNCRMLEYRGRVFTWNAVDVLVDGLLQHGKIVNLAEGGLIIDFECIAQRSQFVAFGPVFRCDDEPRYWDIPKDGQPMQVLLRQHPDAPWTWYPGKTVPLDGYCFREAAFVQVQLPHGTVEELIGRKQVRPALRGGNYEDLRRVAPHDFVIRACPLPVGYWSEASPQLEKILKSGVNERYRVLCTTVLSQTLCYLQGPSAPHHITLTPGQLQEQCDIAKQELASDGSISAPLGTGCLGATFTARKKRKVAARRRCLPLPTELLLEVFQALDSIERFRCRRVCYVWNSILTTAAYFPDARVSASTNYDKNHSWEGIYWVQACLLKCLTNATKIAVISNLDEREQCGRLAMRRRMPCRRCASEWYGSSAALSYAHRQPQSRSTPSASALILPQPLDLPALAELITEAVADNREYRINHIIRKILNTYQSADPRPTTRYRGRQWTVEDLADLDLTTLTTLTVTILADALMLGISCHFS
ncbi:uncharacterized protein LOC129600260 [Paramacrobiotus metropolitanus]|uniref:uncharacterized protein LOC129600260 n=1 Tax=Paramacrobiotus metropolitanus TaxID=2943436 RepID=UPI0024461DB0|nr:uncharacterized protein LOC129600260 [Paramacrobiotus metropolitanus]